MGFIAIIPMELVSISFFIHTMNTYNIHYLIWRDNVIFLLCFGDIQNRKHTCHQIFCTDIVKLKILLSCHQLFCTDIVFWFFFGRYKDLTCINNFIYFFSYFGGGNRNIKLFVCFVCHTYNVICLFLFVLLGWQSNTYKGTVCSMSHT